MDHANFCFLTGTLAREVVAGEGASGCRFTLKIDELGRDGKTYATYVPCHSWGLAADRAVTLVPGDLLCVQGMVKWRKGETPSDKGTLVVNISKLTVLHQVNEAAETEAF